MRDLINAVTEPVESPQGDELEESLVVQSGITDAVEEQLRQCGLDPRLINNGYCSDFAERVVLAMQGQSADTFAASPRDDYKMERSGQTYDPTAPLHWFVVHMGRCYDAEAADGRDRWQDLPFYQRRRW